jgi:hypothetical protein
MSATENNRMLFSEIMGMFAGELAPVWVYGSEVKVLYNRNEAGWVVTLMNNRGQTIAYPGFKPAHREADTAGVVLTALADIRMHRRRNRMPSPFSFSRYRQAR